MLKRATNKSNQQGKQGGEVSVIIHPRPRLVKPLFFSGQKRLTFTFCRRRQNISAKSRKWSAAKLSSARSPEDDHAADARKSAGRKKTTAAFSFLVFFLHLHLYLIYICKANESKTKQTKAKAKQTKAVLLFALLWALFSVLVEITAF